MKDAHAPSTSPATLYTTKNKRILLDTWTFMNAQKQRSSNNYYSNMQRQKITAALILIFTSNYVVNGLSPKPVAATYSEHFIGVELGYDDLLLTNEIYHGDIHSDQTWYDEYGPNGWNSIMMANDNNKHNWKTIHLIQIRVAFDQPLYIKTKKNTTKIANMADLDGLTRLQCGREIIESHCEPLEGILPTRGNHSKQDEEENLHECDHIFTTNYSMTGGHHVLNMYQHRDDRFHTYPGDQSNVYSAFLDLSLGGHLKLRDMTMHEHFNDEEEVAEYDDDFFYWLNHYKNKTTGEKHKCFLHFLDTKGQTLDPPITLTNAGGEVYHGSVELKPSTPEELTVLQYEDLYELLRRHHMKYEHWKNKKEWKHKKKNGAIKNGIDIIREAIASGHVKNKKMKGGGAFAADVYAYLEMRHKMRHTEEMLVSEAEEALEEPLLNMMIPEIKKEFVSERPNPDGLRADTINYLHENITKNLEQEKRNTGIFLSTK